MYYNGVFMTAKARGRVQLDHKKTRLVTEHLDYDRIYDVGMFMNGGTLYDGENVLVSDWGQYTPYLHEAFFTDNVELTNPNFTMVSDTLFYNSATEIAKIVSPTNINAKDGTFVYGLRGNYDTKNGTADLMDRSYIIRDMRKIVADSMHYNKELAVSEAFSNVVVTEHLEVALIEEVDAQVARAVRRDVVARRRVHDDCHACLVGRLDLQVDMHVCLPVVFFLFFLRVEIVVDFSVRVHLLAARRAVGERDESAAGGFGRRSEHV